MKKHKDKALGVARSMRRAAGGPVPKKETKPKRRFEIDPDDVMPDGMTDPMEIHPDSMRGMNPDLDYSYPRRLADGGEAWSPPQNPYRDQEVRSYTPSTGRDRWGAWLSSILGGDEESLSPAKRNLVEGLVGSTGLGKTENNRNHGMSLSDLTPLGAAFAVQEALKKKDLKEAALNAVPGSAAAKATLLGPFGAMMQRRMAREAGKPAAIHPVIGQEVKDKTAHIRPELRDAVRGWEADKRDAVAEYNLSRPADDYRDRLTFSESGWSRAKDGKARKEFQDTGSKLVHNPDNSGTFLLDHPQVDLHKIYDVPPIKFIEEWPVGEGAFSPTTRGSYLGGTPNKTTLKKSISPALHEVGTHAVQGAEGFAKGSAPILELEAERLLYELGGKSEGISSAFQKYRARPGEVEPTNVQDRYAKSHRYMKYPADTERIPRSDQLPNDVGDELTPDRRREIFGYASGGAATAPMLTNRRGTKFNSGALKSTIPGRTDKIPLKVKAGSYVLPADIPSALGEGNTDAGTSVLDKMFKKGPYGMSLPRAKKGSSTQMSRSRTLMSTPTTFADGGETPDADIIAAGGEYVLDPMQVMDVGAGDLDAGHKVLDAFVKQVRAKHIDTLKKLPGPKGG